jgi:ubiquinone biosynthesis protein COQ9
MKDLSRKMISREEFLLKHAESIEKKGWCREAFDDPLFPLIFPDGLLQAAYIYFDWTMKKTFEALSLKDVSELKTFAKVRLAVLTRFEVLSPYKGIERSLFYYLLKHPKGVSFLYKIVNEIWYFAGDKSLDHNFYSKRFLLAGVYTSSFMAFLKDDTPDLNKTQKKLDERLAQVGKIPKLKERLKTLLRFRS